MENQKPARLRPKKKYNQKTIAGPPRRQEQDIAVCPEQKKGALDTAVNIGGEKARSGEERPDPQNQRQKRKKKGRTSEESSQKQKNE